MTSFILPCGTSLLDHLGHAVAAFVDQARALRINEAPPPDWVGALKAAAVPLGAPDPLKVSAESASLHRHQPNLVQGDHVVLLASDTPEGVAAAILNARLFGGATTFWTDPPTDGAAPTELERGRRSAKADIIRVAGLAPIRTDTFAGAMEVVARAFRWVVQRERGEVVLLLTGGYKATVPYLTVLAEYAKALAPVQAFCLHEGDGVNIPDPIEIFLRTVDLAADRAEIDGALLGDLGSTEGRLRGFAFKRGWLDDRDELTPLGRAIKAFLDAY